MTTEYLAADLEAEEGRGKGRGGSDSEEVDEKELETKAFYDRIFKQVGSALPTFFC